MAAAQRKFFTAFYLGRGLLNSLLWVGREGAVKARSVASLTTTQPESQGTPLPREIHGAMRQVKTRPMKPNLVVKVEIHGAMRQVKTSPMKLNLVAKLIRGMRVADAIAQMEFSHKKASRFVLTTLLDTQRRATKTYGLNPLNLHVAESFVGKGTYLKRIRYHGKGMHGKMYKYYAHYFLKLREGPAPPVKRRRKEDHKSFKTKKLIEAGPRGIPNSL